MRAMVLPSFGGPELFELRRVEKPTPGPGQILVRVVASGTNPVAAKIRQGGQKMGFEPPLILGYDVSGVVEEIGPGAEDFKVGDEVFYTPEVSRRQAGSYAEYHSVSEKIVARKPASLDHIQAAAVPLAGGTAYEAIIRRLRVLPGETVLVHGGAGGVGSFAVQLAKAAGARVIAVAGSENQETLRSLGVDIPVDYRAEDPIQVAERHTNGIGVDAVFDTLGGDTVQKSLKITRRFGRIAGILGATGDLTPAYSKNITYYGIMLTRERERLERLKAIIDQGKICPLVDKVLPLEQIAEAHQRLDSGHGRGKVVLSVAG